MRSVKGRRSYNNEGRQEAARATRRRIVASAHRLFVERGYEATTIRAIAEGADVAWQTVYAVFGSKPAILATVFDIAVAGDDEPVPIAARASTVASLADPDPRRTVATFADFASRAGARTGPLFPVLEQAASTDPEIAALVDKVNGQRLHGMSRVARALERRGALRQGLTVDRARDVLWMLTGAGTIRTLVDGRGWSIDETAAWLGDAICDLLLRPSSGAADTRPPPSS